MKPAENPGVYKIKDAFGRIYIGSSVSPSRRWRQHLHELRRNAHHSPRLQNIFNKYGEASLTFSVIEDVEAENLEEAEQKAIDVFNPCLNALRYAGPKRMHNDAYYRARLKEGLKAANQRPEYRKARISGQAKTARAVVCSNGMRFTSCAEAARFFGTRSGSVSACCSGKTHKLANGISVKYADGTSPQRTSSVRRTKVLCVETAQEFGSVWKAAAFAKVSRAAINYALKHGTKSGGYCWRRL